MKICIPIVSKNKAEWLHDIQQLQTIPYDLIEWRIDCMEQMSDIFSIAKELRTYLSCPIIATIRNEGTFCSLPWLSIYKELILMQCVDYVDVEILSDYEDIVLFAHQYNVQVIGSVHNFNRSFTNFEWQELYNKMKQANVDIYKFASMPQSNREVVDHLLMTYDIFCEDHVSIISICMGEIGKISRIVSGLFGSILTFGCFQKKSAPGQIEATLLKSYLEAIDM